MSFPNREMTFIWQAKGTTNIFLERALYFKRFLIILSANIFLEIKDDGIGFDTNILTHRNGIKNIHNRMEKWDGDVSIHSAPGSGTQIKVRFPVD